MPQIKIYGLKSTLQDQETPISDAVHAAMIEHLVLPLEKRFHRFFALEPENFLFPDDRSDNYLILEISMFEGRAVETKKSLIRALFANLEALGFANQDVEITIFESPRENWGIRGMPSDELGLNYKVEV